MSTAHSDLTVPGVGEAIRGEFPILEHTAYVNACSQGALSHRVRAAYEEYLAGWDAHGAEWEHWVERAEAARAAFSRLLHVTPGRGGGDDVRLAGGQLRSSARSTCASGRGS